MLGNFAAKWAKIIAILAKDTTKLAKIVMKFARFAASLGKEIVSFAHFAAIFGNEIVSFAHFMTRRANVATILAKKTVKFPCLAAKRGKLATGQRLMERALGRVATIQGRDVSGFGPI